VRAQVADAQVWIEACRLQDSNAFDATAAWADDVSWVLHGTAKGTTYNHDAVLMVAGGAAPSPYSRAFDPIRLPRIQAVERDLVYWLNYFDKNPLERFVSDGDANSVTVPTAKRDKLRDEFRTRGRRTLTAEPA
jgi:hypothetical protein